MSKQERAIVDDETLKQMIRDSISNRAIIETVVASSIRLKRIRSEMREAGEVVPGPGDRRQPKRKQNPKGAAKTKASKARQKAAVVVEPTTTEPEQTPVVKDDDDDGFTLVATEYLRALEVIAELAREGVENRAEIARLKA